MDNILIVEDSKSIIKSLQSNIEELGHNCIVAKSYKECAEKLLEFKGNFKVALLDLGLPDAPNGEVVDFVTKFNIPSIVLTGSKIEEHEERFRNKNIVDYVIKEGNFSIRYAVSLVKRIISNDKIDILVVDDSRSFLLKVDELLKRYKLNTHLAYNGEEALSILEANPNIKLVLTDYYMPKMDGLELTKKIRKKYNKDELAIIVASSDSNNKVASKFLKYGANDYIYKTFTTEEFYTRLNSNLEILELFKDVKDKANKDYLTSMYNRRYLFDYGEELFQRVKHKKNDSFCVAIIDIDKFKYINDTWGHDVGDIAIKEVPLILSKYVGDNSLMARLGGEEFCILLKDREKEEIKKLFEEVKCAFENNIIKTKKCDLSFTVSIGVCTILEDSLTKMINHADDALYKAKKTGRNKVVYYES